MLIMLWQYYEVVTHLISACTYIINNKEKKKEEKP